MVTGIAEGAPVPSLSSTRVYVASIGIVVGCRVVGDNLIYEASLNITHISVSTDIDTPQKSNFLGTLRLLPLT